LNLAPVEFAGGRNQGVRQPGALAHGIESLAVGLAVDKAQRVRRCQEIVMSLVNAIEEQFEARSRVDSKMVAAFRARVPVGLEILFPDDLPAALALLPESLGADALLAVLLLGGRLRPGFIPFEPGHARLP